MVKLREGAYMGLYMDARRFFNRSLTKKRIIYTMYYIILVTVPAKGRGSRGSCPGSRTFHGRNRNFKSNVLVKCQKVMSALIAKIIYNPYNNSCILYLILKKKF